MDVSLAGALAACRATIDVAKAAIAARDDRLIEDAILDMKDRLMDVTDRALALQEKQSAQAERERQLEDKIRELENRNADFANYELYRTVRGGIAYRSKTQMTAGQDPIYLCANCIAQSVKTFLQPVGVTLRCHIHGSIPSDKEPQKVVVKPMASPWARTW
jgi:microcompartment protein CcmL/EutN